MADERERELREVLAVRGDEPLIATQRVVAEEVLTLRARPARLDD